MNRKVTKKLTHEELTQKFIEINEEVKVVSSIPLIVDESRAYSDPN